MDESNRNRRKRKITGSERSTYQLLFVIIVMIILYWIYWWINFLFF